MVIFWGAVICKTDIKNVQNDTNTNGYKKPHQETQAYGLTSQKRKSLYGNLEI